MSETMLALLGFATIIMIIVLLLKNVTVPAIAFIGVSTVTALILVLTGTFTVKEMGGFIKAGVQGVHSTAALFIFSVLFFGIMTDVGMFDRIINALMKRVGHNVVGVALMTCIIAMIGHLDGGGASTFLITIPAMLPVYKRLKMRPTTPSADLRDRHGRHESSALGWPYHAYCLCAGDRVQCTLDEAYAHADCRYRHCVVYCCVLGICGEEKGRGH